MIALKSFLRVRRRKTPVFLHENFVLLYRDEVKENPAPLMLGTVPRFPVPPTRWFAGANKKGRLMRAVPFCE